MTSGTNKHPFAPGPAISREQLLAYAEGRATIRGQFEVEFATQNDPLLAEAIEGLMMPGAIPGLEGLERKKPKFGSSNGWFRLLSSMIIAVIIPMVIENEPQLEKINDPVINETLIKEVDHSINEPVVENAVMSEVVASLQATTDQTFDQLLVAVERNATIERLQPIAIDPERIVSNSDQLLKNDRHERTGLQLHYLHNLKLIHPKELYPIDPKIQLTNENVTADRADRNVHELKILRPVEQDYLDFMNDALKHFADRDPRKCLEELKFLLELYPNDPNALFYAGMCDLQIGSFRSATMRFTRVLSHRFNVFDEEAEFYHACAMDGKGDRKQAQKAFQKIAERRGFYSERAYEKIEH